MCIVSVNLSLTIIQLIYSVSTSCEVWPSTWPASMLIL
jgi:hypothetical protein